MKIIFLHYQDGQKLPLIPQVCHTSLHFVQHRVYVVRCDGGELSDFENGTWLAHEVCGLAKRACSLCVTPGGGLADGKLALDITCLQILRSPGHECQCLGLVQQNFCWAWLRPWSVRVAGWLWSHYTLAVWHEAGAVQNLCPKPTARGMIKQLL